MSVELTEVFVHFFKPASALIVHLLDCRGRFRLCFLRGSFLRSSLGLLLFDPPSLFLFGLTLAFLRFCGFLFLALCFGIEMQSVHVRFIDDNVAISLSHHELAAVPGRPGYVAAVCGVHLQVTIDRWHAPIGLPARLFLALQPFGVLGLHKG